jgi:hypothetical protein
MAWSSASRTLMVDGSWRQFRPQAMAAAAALVLIATCLVILGTDIRDTYDGYLARCQSSGDCADAMSQFLNEYRNLLLYLDAAFILVPGLLGMFWGAPLVARELETGTHRLGALDLHVTASYQPNHRYWLFQWLESAIYVALTALLAAVGLWRVQRRLTW